MAKRRVTEGIEAPEHNPAVDEKAGQETYVAPGGDYDDVQPGAAEPALEPLLTGQDNGQKPVETPAQKFARLAERRVEEAIRRIERLIPLANKRTYVFGQQEADQIVMALTATVDKVRRAFAGQHEARVAFRLH